MDIQTFHGTIEGIMDTRFECIVCNVERAEGETLWRNLCKDVEALEGMMDRFDAGSEVGRINASVPVSGWMVSREMAEVLGLCRRYEELTGGLFDITCGHSRDYRLGDDGRVTLAGGATLDFGGFAKGYAVERFKGMLESAGVHDAFVNFGGSTVMGMGKHPCGDGWSVDVVSPFTRDVVATVLLNDTTLSTSGNTPWNGLHIVNPRTGLRVEGGGMACAVSPSPLDAEVLSTAAMMLAEEELNPLKNNFPDARIWRV